MNLKNFKKISEDKKSATLQHPAGHKITIAKNALSEKMRKELSSLPMHLDEGTPKEPIQDPTDSSEKNYSEQPDNQPQPTQPQAPTTVINVGTPQPPPPPQAPLAQRVGNVIGNGITDSIKDQVALYKGIASPVLQAGRGFVQGLAGQPASAPQAAAEPPAAMPVPEQAAPAAAAEAPKSPGDPYGTQAFYDNYTSGMGKQIAGINQAAAAEGKLGQEQALIRNKAVEEGQNDRQTYQNNFNQLNQEYKAFQNDVRNQHIDPNHYFSSMGIGGKISTAIGLILGGSDAHGGAGPAMQFINKQIDNDILAQSKNMENSQNLLSANMKQFGNLNMATDMTRLMQMDIVKNQLEEAAAKAQDPMAKAKAMQAIGGIEQQAAPIMSQIAMKKTMMDGMQSGKIDPSMVIRMQVPKEQQNEAFKQLGTAQELMKAKNAALGIFEKLNKENTIGNRLLSPMQTSREVQSGRDNVAVQIARDEAGRVNEYEFKAAQKLFPEPGDNAATLQSKRQDLMNIIQKKMNTPLLDAYGINMGSIGVGSRFNDQGQKRIQLGPVQAIK